MGPKQSHNLTGSKDDRGINKITKNHFEFLYIVGKGGFGKVILKLIDRYGKSLQRKIKQHMHLKKCQK